MQGLGWEGELNSLLREALNDVEIDPLLGLHGLDVVVGGNEIDQLKVQAAAVEGHEMGAVEAGIPALLNDGLQ